MNQPTLPAAEPYTSRQLEMLNVGCRASFGKDWRALVADFERIGKSPSANFVAVVMLGGAVVMLTPEPLDVE